ncbi:MAG TPA: GDSL-type esterase/lipase family protein [Chitinophaga sp.]|uniref:GDSL-type esterase/lipase family protein n=1 Tax=Chitinophaga sp. TaxID=1869181 RepID=UPI002CD3343E|nr:GDSL-type esterase/lipase family protein [Chitinophaga sp.]HVI45488.1 GDSL-type esterase/lipase family protein [Chitinophaga sp.]
MSGENKSAYPFFIIVGSLVCLLALSQLNYTFSYKDFQFRKLDMLSELRTANPGTDHKGLTTDKTGGKPSHLDSATATNQAGAPNPDAVHDFMSYGGILNYASPQTGDNTAGIQRFLTALRELKEGKRKKVRIAYFGDSMIEGDLITSDLRDSLQTYFGGAGVGFVPVTSVVASFRTTINHTFSGNWKDYHYKNSPPSDITLGFSGHTFYPGSDSWVKYSPVRKPHLDKFDEVSLLYGPAEATTVSINDKAYTLSGGAPVNKLDLRQDTGFPSIVLKYAGGPAAPLFGVCFEEEQGIYVDNYSFRGISGVELGHLSADMVRRMQQERPYDLVVLHYGANVLFRPELTDYSWYERPMRKVVDSLRNDLPGTSFLIVGTADKSYKKSDRYITAPGVGALLKVQHDLAAENGTAYWNLFAAMGGEGSMTHWVEGDTVLANKDYTHFNRQGAARVGALLYKAIMNDYRALQP